MIRAAAFAALGLEGIYLASVNVFLNTSLAPAAINRRPSKFEIRWRAGWSAWPGMAVLHGVETRGRSRRIEWDAHLDSVRARFHVLPLFDRIAHLTSVQADGVVYRQRRLAQPDAARKIPAEELPPVRQALDSSAAPTGTTPAASAAPNPARRPWTILADRIECGVDELWFDRFRLTGGMRVETGMSLVVRGPMAFPGIHLTMASGDLRAGERAIFRSLGMDVRAEIHPFIGRGLHRLQFMRFLSGTFALRSDDASLFFLEAYFRKTPWVRFNDRGAGKVVLVLDHGRLRPGTTLDIANDHVDLEFLDRHVTGRGTITGRVETFDGSLRSRVTARLEDFDLAAVGGTHSFARGPLVTLEATSRKMDLADPFTDTHVVVDLPKADLLDLTFYNGMIPAGSKLSFVSGTGTLCYHLEVSAQTRNLRGTIDFIVPKGVARFDGQDLRGGFALRTKIQGASASRKVLDLSGTTLALWTSAPPWKAEISLPRARMTGSQPVNLQARLRLQMQDTEPIIRLYDARKGVPRLLQRLLLIRDLSGGARLSSRGGVVDMKDLEVWGKGLHALADMRFDGHDSDGILYVRLHGFSVGIEKTASGRDLKIVRPLAWFERRRAARRAASR